MPACRITNLMGLVGDSYDNRIVVTFEDGTVFNGDWHGCNIASETFTATPADPTPSNNIAETGSDLTKPLLAAGGWVSAAGAVLLIGTRRRRIGVAH